MNRYDKVYDIYLAKIEDIPDIMDFIETQWRHNHILARDRSFFEYEHVIDGNVNFIIARRKDNRKLDGIIGYIPASKDKEHLDIWTVIWKTRPGCLLLLGLEINNRVNKLTGCRNSMGIGDNPNTAVPLLRKTDKDTIIFKLDHFYLLSDSQEFKIATIYKKPSLRYQVIEDNKIEVEEITEIDKVSNYIDFSDYSKVPYKDEWYINHRYFSNPIYHYLVYGIKRNKNKALIVIRIQEYNGAKALRIMDYIGDQNCFEGLHSFFINLMKNNDCEYTDFYVSGFDNELIYKAGFSKITDDDKNIIPNFFNPFVNQNIVIWADGKERECLFCKADGDQDRPC